jgi:chemotaxis methyl-accepting protein methylase
VNLIENIVIDNEMYLKLLNVLREKTGLNFQYYRRSFIEKRIKSRMIRVDTWTLEEYYNYLLLKEKEVKKFVDGFTINYTFFFRDYDVFETFQDFFIDGLSINKGEVQSNIKPAPNKLAKFSSKSNKARAMVKDRGISSKPGSNYVDIFIFLNRLSFYRKMQRSRSKKNQIYIWSCPCATGEEPYSIAMILDNLEQQVKDFPQYNIVASDIAQEAINKAKKGVYSDDSMKEISDYYQNKYFTRKSTHFGHENIMSERIKNKVDFICEDVTKGHDRPYKYDIIFCRYLLIYFNRQNRDKFLRILENQLAENGILVLGKTETLFNKFGSLKQVDSRNHIYVKSRYSLN